MTLLLEARAELAPMNYHLEHNRDGFRVCHLEDRRTRNGLEFDSIANALRYAIGRHRAADRLHRADSRDARERERAGAVELLALIDGS